jgi:FixJ family two-component response regulator
VRTSDKGCFPLFDFRTVIAVLDDEDSVRRAVVWVLRAAGFTARGFTSGDEFLKTWHFDRPDILLLDLQMPELSGTEVQRALTLGGARFPVVIVTAHDSLQHRDESMRLGPVAFLTKPLDVDVLLQTVTRCRNGWDTPISPPPAHTIGAK